MRRIVRPVMYLGTVAIVLGLGRIHAQFIGEYVFHTSARLPWTLAYAGLLCLAAYGVGLPDLTRRTRSAFAVAVAATAIAAVAISVVQLLLGSLLLPRFVIVVGGAALVPWYVGCSALANVGRAREADRDRVAAVVSAEEVEALRSDLALVPERSAAIVVAMTPEQARPTGVRSRPLVEAVLAASATVVVLDREAQADEAVVGQAAALHAHGVRVRTLSLFYDQWLGKLPLTELERISLMFDIGELHRGRYGRLKRLLDVALGVVGALLLVPILIVVVFGNAVANRGPTFFRQERVGKGGVPFEILKLRTMRPGTEASEWTDEGDRRITPFGRWLRQTHVDELPQVINVLRGDLSVIGPRPEQPHYVAELRDKIPFYDYRLRVRPGLTGWAQVKYAYAASDVDAMEKLQYEFYYLRHQSLRLDVRIIGRTLRSVIARSGR